MNDDVNDNAATQMTGNDADNSDAATDVNAATKTMR
jgi:hypothetical protein